MVEELPSASLTGNLFLIKSDMSEFNVHVD